MKWLRFTKPPSSPPTPALSLPDNPVTTGPSSHKASIVALACRSPRQTHNTHTHPSREQQPGTSPTDRDAMKWNEWRESGREGGGERRELRGLLVTSPSPPCINPTRENSADPAFSSEFFTVKRVGPRGTESCASEDGDGWAHVHTSSDRSGPGRQTNT